jgi:uncharacterized phage protein gp47/JayE
MTQTFRVAELDFDSIKNNLKDYFRNSGTFTDYDFEGSGLSVMLDVLAYNTHYNAIIANMLTQEMFLDTAVKRETVNLHAKKMGYIPKSMRASRAIVNLEVFPFNNPDTITLGKGAVFQSGGQVAFNFTNRDAITISKNSVGRYIFQNIPLNEGRIEKFQYIVSSTTNKFQIPNKNVDVSLLKVFVQTSTSTSDLVEYKVYDSIVEIDGTTHAYFLQINNLGYYEISFGDGIIGKEIQSGNCVTLEYVICNGEVPNGAGSFMLVDSVQGNTNFAVVTVSKASGGAQQESLDSIRENAIKRVYTQNRAVSLYDYKPIVEQIYPVGDVVVWGGENNSPPVYGKVFFSVLDKNNPENKLTPSDKQYIIDSLKKKMMVTITPEIVDPDFLNVEIYSSVYYDQFKTSNSPTQIKTLVFNDINSYVTTNLNMFNAELRHSNFCAAIDSTDSSIKSNITRYVLKKSIYPVINQNTKYTIDFKNPLRESSDILTTIYSDGFYINGESEVYYFDDLSGNIRIFRLVNGVKTDIRNIGTVNYSTGKIFIDNIIINSTVNGSITFRCFPVSNDIICVNNMALIVNQADININVIVDSQTNHTFSSSI